MKILCITNNPISLNNANGKFIRNYLHAFSPKELCNFYITNEKQADNIDSFNVTNFEALKKLITLGLCKKKKLQINNNGSVKNTATPLKHILRFIVWNTGLWKLYGFTKWINKNNPTHIILALADNPYLIKLAHILSKKRKIQIINIVGENYSIKNYDYLTRSLKMSLIYKCFRWILQRETKKVIFSAKCNVFNTPLIEQEYKNHYHGIKGVVFYPPADDIKFKTNRIRKNSILYAGNLGLNRDVALIEFAEELTKHFPEKTIYVYSKENEEFLKKIKNLNNIKYMGFVTNEKLNTIVAESELTLHVESNTPYNLIDLKTAFSTKIANNIIHGNKFFIYAPKELAESQFFLEYLPENIAVNKKDISKKISMLYQNDKIIPEKVKYLLDINRVSGAIRKIILD